MMRLVTLKKRLIKKLIVLGIILALLAGVFFAIHSWKQSLVNDEQQLKNKISSIRNQLDSSKIESKELIDALNSYKSFDERKLPTASGFDKDSKRIGLSTPIIERYKNKYQLIGKPEVTFSNATTNNEFTKIKSYKIIESDLEIVFAAATDELAYAFVYDMIEAYVGYMTIKSFEITRKVDLEPGFYKELRRSTNFPPLIEARVLFNWKTLKGKPIDVDTLLIESKQKLLEQ